MDIRTTLIDFESLQANLERNAERVQESVQEAAQQVSPEDAMERARLMAAFNNAIGRLKDENKRTRRDVVRRKRAGLAPAKLPR